MRSAVLVAAAVVAFVPALPAGGGVPCALADLNIDPHFSPDGSRIAFVNGGGGGCTSSGRLLAVDVRTGAASHLLPGVLVETPRFSPDGRRVVVAALRSQRFMIELIEADGFSRALAEGREPDWSPDGREIAFTRDVAPTAFEIWAIRPDGTGLRRVGSGSVPLWSPDGAWIAARGRRGIGGVAVMRRDGSEHRLLPDNLGWSRVAWSPDSRRIAYLTGASAHEVRLVSVETGEVETLPVPGGRYPVAWSADGARILLQGGAAIAVATGELTRPLGDWDVRAVTPDWDRAAVAIPAGPYAYEGNDLYVAGPAVSPRLVSPLRCTPGVASCLEGDDRDDSLAARLPFSWIRGLAGHDLLTGSRRSDRIEGAFGDDVILGGAGNDHLFGHVGRDRIVGADGDDLIDGGADDDVLASGTGRGRVFGGTGADRIDARAGRGTFVWCGDGSDAVLANRTTRVSADCEHVSRTRGRGRP